MYQCVFVGPRQSEHIYVYICYIKMITVVTSKFRITAGSILKDSENLESLFIKKNM